MGEYLPSLWLNNIPLCICTTSVLFIHPNVDGHLVCFHISSVVNNAALNVGVHIFYQNLVYIILNVTAYLHLPVCCTFSYFSSLNSILLLQLKDLLLAFLNAPSSFVCLEKSLSLLHFEGQLCWREYSGWQVIFLSELWIDHSNLSWPIRFQMRNPLIVLRRFPCKLQASSFSLLLSFSLCFWFLTFLW